MTAKVVNRTGWGVHPTSGFRGHSLGGPGALGSPPAGPAAAVTPRSGSTTPQPLGVGDPSRDPRSRPLAEADAHQPAVGPVLEPGRPDGAGVVGLVEIRDDLRQHGLTFSWVGDRRGPCGQIRVDPILEVEGEGGTGEKVRVPVGRGAAGAA